MTAAHAHVTVWGLAAGVRTTKDAARGAFTARTYNRDTFQRFAEDWLDILYIVPGLGAPPEGVTQ